MKIVLTSVGITLAIVIAVVAAVYGWAVMTGRRATPEFLATGDTEHRPERSEPTVAPSPPRESKPAPPATPPPSTFAPQPTTLVPTASPKPTTTTTPPTANSLAPTPGLPPSPAGAPSPGATAPTTPAPSQGPQSPAPSPPPERDAATVEKLLGLQVGMTEDQATALMGNPGAAPAGYAPYRPIGWYERRWTNSDGSWISAVFNDTGVLVAVDQYKIPAADEWTTSPHYAVVSWMNAILETHRMPVRVPAVDAVQSAPAAYHFQGPLTAEDGSVVGSISGAYYPGDGATTYIPGDTIPFKRAIEGAYQYTLVNGLGDANTFSFVEH